MNNNIAKKCSKPLVIPAGIITSYGLEILSRDYPFIKSEPF